MRPCSSPKTVNRLTRRSSAGSYRSIASDSRTGLGKPGSKTGGEIREASGTAFVSTAVPATDRRPAQRHSGNITGRDHQREPERDLAVTIRQDAHHGELDGRDIAGHQVADAQAENARPLFLGDRRAMPLRMAWVYSRRACPRSLRTPSTTRPATSMRKSVTAARSGSGKI